jgi:hypothetical protein
MSSICFYVVCGSYCGVSFMIVGICIHIDCMFCKFIMGYEFFIYSIDMCLDVFI